MLTASMRCDWNLGGWCQRFMCLCAAITHRIWASVALLIWDDYPGVTAMKIDNDHGSKIQRTQVWQLSIRVLSHWVDNMQDMWEAPVSSHILSPHWTVAKQVCGVLLYNGHSPVILALFPPSYFLLSIQRKKKQKSLVAAPFFPLFGILHIPSNIAHQFFFNFNFSCFLVSLSILSFSILFCLHFCSPSVFIVHSSSVFPDLLCDIWAVRDICTSESYCVLYCPVLVWALWEVHGGKN